MVLASRGQRDLGSGLEKIEKEEELGCVRTQSRRVWIQTWVLTTLMTALAVVVPELF
ncbi:MAG: hypothetical protein HY791_09600 [Deltaproteobacteria bacterium]|nr:hypothetical protein [Deltaproteobacteria bacterium]